MNDDELYDHGSEFGDESGSDAFPPSNDYSMHDLGSDNEGLEDVDQDYGSFEDDDVQAYSDSQMDPDESSDDTEKVPNENPTSKFLKPLLLVGGLAVLGGGGFWAYTNNLIPYLNTKQVAPQQQLAAIPTLPKKSAAKPKPQVDQPTEAQQQSNTDIDLLSNMGQSEANSSSAPASLPLSKPSTSHVNASPVNPLESQLANPQSRIENSISSTRDQQPNTVDVESLKKDIVEELRSQHTLSEQDIQSIVASYVQNNVKIPSVNTDQFVNKNELKGLRDELSSIRNLYSTQRISHAQYLQLTQGRTRLPGFVIINKSLDGTMAVCKTPSGNVNVYFKGEHFYAGKQLEEVESIADGGFLVLVSNDHFIDTTETPIVHEPKRKPTVDVVPTKKPAEESHSTTPTKPQTVKHEPANIPATAEVSGPKLVVNHVADANNVQIQPVIPHDVPDQQNLDYTTIPTNQLRAQIINGKQVAIGYTKNGEFTKGFIIKDPHEKFNTYKVGDTIPGLGLVAGLDLDGNLIVGDYVIMSVESH